MAIIVFYYRFVSLAVRVQHYSTTNLKQMYKNGEVLPLFDHYHINYWLASTTHGWLIRTTNWFVALPLYALFSHSFFLFQFRFFSHTATEQKIERRIRRASTLIQYLLLCVTEVIMSLATLNATPPNNACTSNVNHELFECGEWETIIVNFISSHTLCTQKPHFTIYVTLHSVASLAWWEQSDGMWHDFLEFSDKNRKYNCKLLPLEIQFSHFDYDNDGMHSSSGSARMLARAPYVRGINVISENFLLWSITALYGTYYVVKCRKASRTDE